MRRYWIPGISEKDSLVKIAGDEFHHICDVCRQVVGSRFEVITESGWALLVELEQVLKKEALATVIEKRQIPPLAKPHINLAISVPKIATFEAVIEKAVELGTYKVWPFYSDYSFVKSQKNIFTAKAPRFEKIVQGATQQTGRGDLMAIAKPLTLPEILTAYTSSPKAAGIFAYEGEGGRPLSEALSKESGTYENLWLFVGSEGGFSQQEVEIFKKTNLFPVSLGQQVLRVETACVTLLSIIKYQIGQF
jgi:16S rRNA (uracil1498-N3)-methyltransferase